MHIMHSTSTSLTHVLNIVFLFGSVLSGVVEKVVGFATSLIKFSKETHFATLMLLLDLIIEAEKLGSVDLSKIQQRKDGSLGCT